MAVNPLSNTSSRISGMYSGLDTDTLIRNLLKSQQLKIDQQYKKKTGYEWTGEAVNSVSNTVRDFQNKYLSVLGESSMVKSEVYNSFTVSGTDEQGPVGLSFDSEVKDGSFTIAVARLAQNASVSSGSVSRKGDEISPSNLAKLGELDFASELEFENGKISFQINGETFTFSKDDSLQTMINTVNNSEKAGVTMKYSRLTDSFSIEAKSGGADSEIEIVNLKGNAFGENSAFGIDGGLRKNGQNALAFIDGRAVERSSNSFSADGITYKLQKVTTEAESAADAAKDAVRVSYKRDISAAISKVQGFLDGLNELLTDLSAKVSSSYEYSGYEPLSESEKEGMSEKDIEKHEALAKSNLLRRNLEINSLVGSIKEAFLSPAGPDGKSMSGIGIKTGSYFISEEKGRFTIDTEAFTRAFEEEPEALVKMFTHSTDSKSEQGILYKLRDAMGGYISGAKDSVTKTKEAAAKVEDRISLLEQRLLAAAERQYQKFAAMEEALARMESQSGYLAGLFSSALGG